MTDPLRARLEAHRFDLTAWGDEPVFERKPAGHWVPWSEVDAALRAAPLDEWQPIETAPTDGTTVLLWWPFWCRDRPVIGWFGIRGIDQWCAPEALEGDGDPPTHWMPLPAAPRSTIRTNEDHTAAPGCDTAP